MKQCFLSTQRSWGGGEQLLSQLILSVQQLGAQASLAAPEASPMATWATQQHDLPLLALPGKARGPRAMWKLRQWVQQQQAEVVLLNDPHAITYGGLATMGLATTRVGVRHTVFPVRSGWKHRNLIDRVLCVSDAARQECLKAGVEASRIEVIHAGVAQRPADPHELADARALFAQAKQSPQEKNLLGIGSLLPVKGFVTAIQAIANAKRLGHTWRFWIAGDGPERDNLANLAKQLGIAHQVHFLGFRKDITALLSAADLFVSASHNEGFSLVVVEAMLAGCPVVATPVGGCREVLGVDQSNETPNAWTFSPGDPDGLIQGALAALDPELATSVRVANAQAWAEERFTINRMAHDYMNLSRRVA